jgi:hypothetical protein
VAEEKKFETAEELGAAVGEKIDELFGGAMDETPPKPAHSQAETGTHPAESSPEKRKAPDEEIVPTRAPHSTDEPDSVVPRSLHSPDEKKHAQSEEELLDRLEALALNLEWEYGSETVREMALRFKELEGYLPQEGPARTLITINRRVLRRFSRPEVSPHPKLATLLQESNSAMRRLCAPGGQGQLARESVSSIVKTYNEIMGSAKQADVPEAGETGPDRQDVGALISNMSGAVNSLAEVGKRLARIRAALNQGGEISEDETARKLERLERLFDDRIGHLSSLHKKLSRLAPFETTARSSPEKRSGGGPPGSDGFLMIEWNGQPIAVPSSLIMALHPLTSSQAQQLRGKNSVVLAKRSIPRVPLSEPKGAAQDRKILPSWLIHFSIGDREFFILADRALGYRRVPEGTDLSRQRRMKIGKTVYSILNRAALPPSTVTSGSE